jgi:hypothetical protein
MIIIALVVLMMMATAPAVSFAGDMDVVLQTQGFLGERALGLGYEFNSRHRIEATVGTYHVDSDEYRQLNIGYTYSPFQLDWNCGKTKIFSPGIYALFTRGHDLYFVHSPDRYPYKDYYDPNGVRLGITLAFSHVFQWASQAVEIVYQIMALDQGVIADYNNPEEDELDDFMSSGLMVRVRF